MKIGDKEVKFVHTAVNKDAHLFIDGTHDPELCIECIRPGTLSFDTPSTPLPELDELLNDYLNACIYEQGAAWEQEEKIKEAEQAITDWHNKQIEEVLDRLEQVHRANPLWVNMTQRAIPLSAIEAERNKLKED